MTLLKENLWRSKKRFVHGCASRNSGNPPKEDKMLQLQSHLVGKGRTRSEGNCMYNFSC